MASILKNPTPPGWWRGPCNPQHGTPRHSTAQHASCAAAQRLACLGIRRTQPRMPRNTADAAPQLLTTGASISASLAPAMNCRRRPSSSGAATTASCVAGR